KISDSLVCLSDESLSLGDKCCLRKQACFQTSGTQVIAKLLLCLPAGNEIRAITGRNDSEIRQVGADPRCFQHLYLIAKCHDGFSRRFVENRRHEQVRTGTESLDGASGKTGWAVDNH